jgi:hypothetical protein
MGPFVLSVLHADRSASTLPYRKHFQQALANSFLCQVKKEFSYKFSPVFSNPFDPGGPVAG